MGDIRKNQENGGVVLSEEQKKILEHIAQHNLQEYQLQADNMICNETEKNVSKEKNSKDQKKKINSPKIVGLIKNKNPQQEIVDRMVDNELDNKKKNREENNEREMD